MERFVQLHILTSYPPSNLNRDDLGRPKTAVMGGRTRLRISSQSLKRAWRTSDLFKEALDGYVGIRTKAMGVEVYKALVENGVKEKKAFEWAKKIAAVFGRCKKEKKDDKFKGLETEQLVHFGPAEQAAIDDLVEKLVSGGKDPSEEDLKLLKRDHAAADIAMFGRMVADHPAHNIEAAVQVAHAITVHEVAVEDDFFTAVDELNTGEEDMGAGHMGETEFAAGVFYLYLCIDRGLLLENLGGREDLYMKSVAALVEAAAKVAPTGKQNSFGSRAYASYVMAEKGNQQPRSLSVAYLKPVGGDYMSAAIDRLEEARINMEKVYGPCSDAFKVMNAQRGKGSLEEIIRFVTE